LNKSTKCVLLTFLLLLSMPSRVSAKAFVSCTALQRVYSPVIARSVADKSSFIATYSPGAVEPTAIAAMPKIYKENKKLDFDNDGLICEEKLEQSTNDKQRATNAGTLFDILDNKIKGITSGAPSGSTSSKWNACSFNGRNMWGAVYFTSKSWEADFKVIYTSNSFNRDLAVFMESSLRNASTCGLWFAVPNSWQADFKVAVVTNPWDADFSIYSTNRAWSAGRG
jgi:hypothetical protein